MVKPTKQKRKRGLILTPEGLQKLQAAKIASEANENYGTRYTLEDLSERVGVNTATISKVLSGEEAVDKRTLEFFFQAFKLKLDKTCYTNLDKTLHQDWGEAICTSVFYGRTEELATLAQWILRDRCRTVALLGMGGIGKTAVSVKLAEQIKSNFEYVIWRSLREAPPIKDILANLIEFVSEEQKTEASLPESVGERVSRLIDYLRQYRCLLILDNMESILRSGCRAGVYREGYEGYGELLRRVGEATHQSCLILTSREKPKDVALLEGESLCVRSFQLRGLKSDDGKEIIKVKGISGSESDLKTLVERYVGNALALKVVATTIQDLFMGSVSEFLEQSTVVFGDIWELLDQHFSRLSSLEKNIMYWLVINREPVLLSDLRNDIVSPIPPQKLLETLESLRRRSLVEINTAALFTLQSVVMEYVTNRLVDTVCEEIETENLELFRCHAIMKATAKDYIRDDQIRLILQPIIDGLLNVLRSRKCVENKLNKILVKLQETSPQEQDYTTGNILNLFCKLQTDLSGYDFSYLTVWQADLRNVNLHNVNLAHANFDKSIFAESFGGILSLAFSPDGQLLVTGDMMSEIRFYLVADWKRVLTIKDHTDWVSSIAFSPDSSILVSGSQDKTIRIWNISDGKCLKVLQGHNHGIWSVAISPDGHLLASGSDDKTIKIWDMSNGTCLKTLQEHNNMVRTLVFSPDGKILATGSLDKTLKLWDTSTFQCHRTLHGHDDGVWSANFSPDGSMLASVSSDQTIKLWDVNTGEILATVPAHSGWINSVAFHPDGEILATGSWDTTVKLWNLSINKCIKTLQGHNALVRAVVFSPDGEMLATGSDDQLLKVWSVSTAKCLKTLQGYSDTIWSIALSPDGQMVASCGDSKTVKLWNIETGKCLKTFVGHSNTIRSVAFSFDGCTIASGSNDKTVKIWDVNTGKCKRTLQGHTSLIWSIALSSDGELLASGSTDQTVRLWDISDGTCKKILHKDSHGVLSVVFSPDGQTLASGGTDQTIRLWDISDGTCKKTLHGHGGWVWSVAFSPDGQTLVSGGTDQTVRLWDISDGTCKKTLHGHGGWVWSVAFSSDGQTLASSSTDQTVRLWDISDGTCKKTLYGHSGGVVSVIFSSMGNTVISSSEDEKIKFWNILTGECLGSLRSPRPYENMNITGVTGLTEAMIVTLKTLGAVN